MDKKQGLDKAKKRYEFLRTLAGVSCIISGCVSLIHSPLLSVGLIIAGGTIFMDKMWASILGLICSIPITILSSISLVLSTLFLQNMIIDLFHEEFYGLLIFLLSSILILNIINIIIMFTFRKHSKKYWNKYYNAVNPQKSGKENTYGVCPRCKCSELEFVDGVNYRCAKCGYNY